VLDGVVIGCTDVDQIRDGCGSLGYWFDEACWGQGLATEAAQAAVDFAISQLRLRRLVSGHASDNPASGRVLEKLGFRRTGEGEVLSKARKATIRQLWYELRAPPEG
jgi:ribosomal-protein-alanine N-acetyltransferase